MTDHTMTPEKAAALRAKFPLEHIGKLPRGNIEIDYVGHAAVTDRLLSVDAQWTWEPLAYDDVGLPAYDRAGGLWIKLTVCGVTRLGYGDGPDPKQRIGDALRNAAMRFGVALDLWHRGGDLHDDYAVPEGRSYYGRGEAPVEQETKPPPAPPRPGKTPDEWRDILLAAKSKTEVRHALRDASMDGHADAEVADENGEMLTIEALAMRQMKAVPA